jgi:hypothetical protein
MCIVAIAIAADQKEMEMDDVSKIDATVCLRSTLG